MFEWKQQSPLIDDSGQLLAYQREGLWLRVDTAGANSITLVQQIATVDSGIALPIYGAIKLSPYDGLLLDPGGDNDSLNGFPQVSTDLSDRYALIEAGGDDAPALLKEATSAPIASLISGGADALVTQLFEVPVIIRYCTGQPCFRLYVDRSLAAHLWLCLAV